MPRTYISIVFAFSLLFAPVVSARMAQATDYPIRPVKIIVQTPAGTAPDVICRLLAELFAERFPLLQLRTARFDFLLRALGVAAHALLTRQHAAE